MELESLHVSTTTIKLDSITVGIQDNKLSGRGGQGPARVYGFSGLVPFGRAHIPMLKIM